MSDGETTEAGQKTMVLATRLTPPEYVKVKAAAAKELLPVSIYIRRMLLHPDSGGRAAAA